MTKEHLSVLFEYHCWANEKISNVISDLNSEEFSRHVAGGHGSVRNTLVHMVSTDWGWLSRCGGHKRDAKLLPDDFSKPEEILKLRKKVEGYSREFIQSLSDSDMIRKIEYSGNKGMIRSMPIGELMHHAMVHGCHHRGQLAILMRELGYDPGNFDILFYYAEKHGVPAW